MDRRTFFNQGRTSIAIDQNGILPAPEYAFKTNRNLASGSAPYTGTWGRTQVIHLLRRTMFGAAENDIQHFLGKSISDAVDELLTSPSTQPSPPINNYNTPSSTDPNVAAGQTWVNAPDDPNFGGKRRYSLKAWWTGQMINQGRSIHEKMVLFWHNHFATESNLYASPIAMYKQQQLLRNDALGNFKQMTRDITLDTAMLVYLNGYLNTKNAPDENYGRELQELFTLGKGPNSQYTESDVKEAAKVLTGWRVNRNTSTTYFDANKHDTSNKTFSSFYNNTVITGKSGATAGDDELDALLSMIFNKEEVSKFMVRKLYKWFVYYDIDSTTETNVIEPLAQIFRQNNYDIKPVLLALFKSEHFYDPANMGALIKSPIDFSVGICRQFNVKFPDATDYVNQYYMWQTVYSTFVIMQQDLGDPPSVSGWPAYYQVPGFHELWINSDTLPKRNQISDVLAYVGFKRSGFTLIIDPIEAAKLTSKPEDPNVLVKELSEYLHTLPISKTSSDTYKISTLLSGQNSDHYWQDAWNLYLADPNNATNKAIVTVRIQALLKGLMNLSEYQLS